jgi:selenocysteine-specific elongation factor
MARDAKQGAAVAIGPLAQPLIVGEAARAMGTSCRVAVPLLERLDATLVTRRPPLGRREVREAECDHVCEPDRGHEDQVRGIRP